MKNKSSNHLDLVRFPLSGLRLIEASAGTGKTYSIAAFYVRLVLGHGRYPQPPLNPPDLLVLTFTRAATQELRERIRTRLNEVAAAFRRADPGQDEFVARLLADYSEEEFKACARRLQVAADWMDEAAIHTIHAWCQTMLRQHAFDSGSLFTQEVDSEDRELFDQVVKDYWRRHFYADQIEAFALRDMEGDLANFSRTVSDLLKPGLVIQHGGKDVEVAAPDRLMERLELALQQVREQWKVQRNEIVERLKTAVAGKFLNRPYNAPGALDEWFLALDDWAGTAGAYPEELNHFRREAIEGARSAAAKKAGVEVAEHAWFNQVSQLFTMPAASGIYAHAVCWIRQRYQAEKRKRKQLDFNDLLVQLDEALAGERGDPLRRRILQKFPVAMIDEFQDTDPVQYRIFERVYLPERHDRRHALIMIGDPKQSIYSFRGADIHTYLAAQSKLSTEDRFTLSVNHRSTKPMVDALNCLFEAGRHNPRGAFGFRTDDVDPLPFEPVTAEGRKERLVIDGETPSPLTFWYQHPEQGKSDLSKATHQPLMADLTTSQIVELLNGSRQQDPRTGFLDDEGQFCPIRPSDIAVLVSDRYDAARIQEALRARGVGSVYLSARDSVFAQPEAIDVLAILEAASQPLDVERVRRALAATSLCLDVTELDAINRDEGRLEREIGMFQRLGQIWREHGVLAMLRRLLAEKSIPARLRAASPSWERQLTNLLHLAELLQAESIRRDGAQALINWLHAEIARDNRSENDSAIIRLESDEGLIRIVTVHKSKGLQYSLVFVPFAGCYTNPRSIRFLSFQDDQGRRVAELDTCNPEAIERSRREALQERIRLLYVALTRARHACWVGVAPVNQCNDAGLNQLLTGLAETLESDTKAGLYEALAHLASDSRQIDLVEALAENVSHERLLPDGPDFECEPALEYPERRYEPWWIGSYSALRHAETGSRIRSDDSAGSARLAEMAAEAAEDEPVAQADAGQPQPGTVHHFHRGAPAGNLLHDLLEWAGHRGFAATLEDEPALGEQIRNQLTRRRWQDQTAVLQDWLPRLLKTRIRLGDRSVRLVDLKPGCHRYRCELGFMLAAGGVSVERIDPLVTSHTLGGKDRPAFAPAMLRGMLSGFIDLVFEHEGRWYVADYKSNYLGPDTASYSAPRLAKAMLDKRYDLQYVFYTLALHRLLRQRLGQAYRPAEQLGGAAYLFLRGCDNKETGGVFFEPARIELIDTLDRMFARVESSHVA